MLKPTLILALSLVASSAQAGSLANGNWSNARCGEKPPVASLDLRNPDAYNKSVEGVNIYRQKINVFLDCLVAEGNLDIQLISKAISTEQQGAREALEKVVADAKLASEKFKDK